MCFDSPSFLFIYSRLISCEARCASADTATIRGRALDLSDAALHFLLTNLPISFLPLFHFFSPLHPHFIPFC